MNSREKGKRGERMWRDELRANGFAARRGQQFSGSPNSPDVVCESLPHLHFEVKCVERLNLHAAMRQAHRDCARKIPIVAHKRNYGPWCVTLPVGALCRLLWGTDVIVGQPEWLHVVFKRRQRLDLISACAHAEGNCCGKPWVLLHQRNDEPCLATMRSEVFFRFLRGDLPEAKAENLKADTLKSESGAGTGEPPRHEGHQDGAQGLHRPTQQRANAEMLKAETLKAPHPQPLSPSDAERVASGGAQGLRRPTEEMDGGRSATRPTYQSEEGKSEAGVQSGILKSEVFGESPSTTGGSPVPPQEFLAVACAAATSTNNKPTTGRSPNTTNETESQ